ncbi:MAG: DMT family protein [Symbiopectobacterium sp.]|uniref:DMT family protein n=1 Tax=Symbiopectobacterium sp. TaxID=2952789 RepID=UPI0039E8192C
MVEKRVFCVAEWMEKYDVAVVYYWSPLFITVGMLTLSNVFMTFAWYGHLRYFSERTWLIAALVSWGDCVV